MLGTTSIVAFAALLIFGRIKGPPDLSAPSKDALPTELLKLHLHTNRAWLNKYRRLPLKRQSPSLKKMHQEKMEYVKQLELELISRHDMMALGGMVSGGLGTLFTRIQRLQQEGKSEDDAITAALDEWRNRQVGTSS